MTKASQRLGAYGTDGDQRVNLLRSEAGGPTKGEEVRHLPAVVDASSDVAPVATVGDTSWDPALVAKIPLLAPGQGGMADCVVSSFAGGLDRLSEISVVYKCVSVSYHS